MKSVDKRFTMCYNCIIDEGREVDNMEKFVGEVYEVKEFEYTVVAKVPHATKEGVFVYLLEQRRFGSDEELEYVTREY